MKKDLFEGIQDYFLVQEKINKNSFKTKIFPAKNSDKIPILEQEPEPTVFTTPKPTKEWTNNSKSYVDFQNKITNDETNINAEIFNEYFKYHNPTCLLKDLFHTDETKNNKVVNCANDTLIDVINSVNKK